MVEQADAGSSDDGYKQLYELLYAYRFGTINFLVLLDRMEALVCQLPRQSSGRDPFDQDDMPDNDGCIG